MIVHLEHFNYSRFQVPSFFASRSIVPIDVSYICIIYRSEDSACCFRVTTSTMLSNCMTSAKVTSLDYISSRVSEVGLAAFFYKTAFGEKLSPCFSFHFARPCLMVGFK